MKVYAREYLVSGTLDLVDDPSGEGYALWHTGLAQYWETAMDNATAHAWRELAPVVLDPLPTPASDLSPAG